MRGRRRVRRGGIASAGLALVLSALGVDGPWVESARAADPTGGGSSADAPAPGRMRGRPGAMASPRLRREVMNGLAQALPGARPIERLAILRSAMRLPFAERRALASRLRRFETLSAGERTTLVADLQALLVRADEDIAAFERNLGRWERLSESERERYREQFRRLQEMPFEERERLLEEWDRSRRDGRGRTAGDARVPMGAQSPSGSAGNPVGTGSGTGENPGQPSGNPPPTGDEWADDEAADDPVKERGAQAEP